ncbi:replication initiation protein [Hymenobacter sp. AT01-02]|uniref:replication initiation protein n=1 Tax=Hymenobacter sp. AT01-02 TaxID=1571877 RepID=UPI0005F12D60
MRYASSYLNRKTYPMYKDFKRYVLQACLKELKQNGGWDIGLEEKKTSRKVISVVFTIPRTEVKPKAVKKVENQLLSHLREQQ